MGRGHRALSGILLSIVSTIGGCSPRQEPPPAGLSDRPTPADRVVARVNGSPILAVDLRHQMAQSDSDARAALSQLVRLELLAQEARRRGLADHPEVRWIEKRAEARLLIARDFGARYTKASVPMGLIRQAYERNKHRFVHPELVEVSHLLASAGEGASDARHRQARQLIERARRIAASGPLSPDEFSEIPHLLAREGRRAGVDLKVETLVTPRTGFTVEPFAAAAFALKQPGDLSPVVKTRFGYHLIYLRRRVPPRDSPLEEVAQEVRERVFEEARRIAFEQYLEELESRHRVERLPAALAGAGAEARP